MEHDTINTSRVLHDDWVLPILKDLVPSSVFSDLTRGTRHDYWRSAVHKGIVSDIQILEALARLTHLPLAPVPLQATPGAKYCIPEPIARRYGIVPISVSESSLTVATANPYNLDCEQALGFVSGKRIEFQLAAPSSIGTYLSDLYRGIHASSSAVHENARIPYQPSVVQLVDQIVADGIAKRASDIHLEAEETNIVVRHRIDGVLQPAMTFPKDVGLPLVSRIKIMAHMDIADRLRPQGGRIRVMIQDQAVDLRVSTLPASHGEKVVIRILDSRDSLRTLDALDLPHSLASRLRKLLDVREGLILITGPTGSGKTTTLYAALKHLLQRGLNIITVEDPVEYRVPGIVQVQVNEKAGLTFVSALRSILRQDPDVVLIGEIRDQETAMIAIQAALTGHLVFATLHTIDACSSITRLHDLGVEPTKISAALKGVVAQRLVRRLCRSCMRSSMEPIPPLLWHTIPSGATLWESVGCSECAQTGYKGRIAVTELVPVTQDLERLIASRAPTRSLISAARTAGTQSLWEVGISYVRDGITTAQEIVRVLDAEQEEPAYDVPSEEHNEAFTDSFDVISDDALSMPTESNEPPTIFRSTTALSFSTSHESRPMTKFEIGVVDVYLVDSTTAPWKTLALQRATSAIRPNSWEAVHGKIDPGEAPEQAAIREVQEETGLTIQQLYVINTHSFYLTSSQTVQLAIVFCAFVDSQQQVTLSEEHQTCNWLPMTTAGDQFTWPRARQALSEIEKLLNPMTIKTVEDVLRVKE